MHATACTSGGGCPSADASGAAGRREAGARASPAAASGSRSARSTAGAGPVRPGPARDMARARSRRHRQIGRRPGDRAGLDAHRYARTGVGGDAPPERSRSPRCGRCACSRRSCRGTPPGPWRGHATPAASRRPGCSSGAELMAGATVTGALSEPAGQPPARLVTVSTRRPGTSCGLGRSARSPPRTGAGGQPSTARCCGSCQGRGGRRSGRRGRRPLATASPATVSVAPVSEIVTGRPKEMRSRRDRAIRGPTDGLTVTTGSCTGGPGSNGTGEGTVTRLT